MSARITRRFEITARELQAGDVLIDFSGSPEVTTVEAMRFGWTSVQGATTDGQHWSEDIHGVGTVRVDREESI